MKRNLKGFENKTDTKKVSFVVPVYKSEQYLEKCLKLLLGQDYKNVEIVVVADGESKEAEKIVKKLQVNDDRIKKYVTIEHGGAPKARNEGFKYISGDYVSFWDSDCYIEQGAVRMWVKIFNMRPDISFVYSGYRFEGSGHFIPSQAFDDYLLTCNNYIATMFPMKREIFPGFDESLKSLQDWDLWLTIAEKGHKGFFLEGSAFSTEMRRGISSEGCTNEEWLNRYKAVREKHGIKGRDICFTATNDVYKRVGVNMARWFGQDYLDHPDFKPHEYKLIYLVSFFSGDVEGASRVFKGASKNCKKIVHWVGEDIETMLTMPYKGVKSLVSALNETVTKQYVSNEVGRQMLEELGIKAEIKPLPVKYEEVEIPKDFTVYYETDKGGETLTYSVINANPDITFGAPDKCSIKDWACFMSFTSSQFPSENMRKFQMAGRHLITNYQDLYAGYCEPDKEKIVRRLRELKKAWTGEVVNLEAKKYWIEQTDPDRFISELKGLI